MAAMDKLSEVTKSYIVTAIEWLWSKKFISALIGVASAIFCYWMLPGASRAGVFPFLLTFFATMLLGYNYFNVKEKVQGGSGATENKT